MSISYIGGATGSTGGVAGTSATATYSPTAGHTVVVAVAFSGNTTSQAVKDQNGNALTLVSGQAARGLFIFEGTAITGATSYKATWTTSVQCTIAVTEYSGATGGVGQSINAQSGDTLSITPAGTGNYMIFAVSTKTTGVTYTATTGNIRESGGTTSSTLALGDNNAVSGGLITCQFTESGGTPTCVAFELLAAVDVPTVSNNNSGQIYAITSTGATNSTLINWVNGANVTTVGCVYDTVSVPTNPGNVTPGSSGYAHNVSTGSLNDGNATAVTQAITGLTYNTQYYTRFFVQNSAGYTYDTELTFSTGPILFVGGASAISSASEASHTITYTPTAGNFVVVGICFSAAVTGITVADNHSNALTLFDNQTNTYLYYGTAVSGATGYTVSWTTSTRATICIAEYSTVSGIAVTDSKGNQPGGLNQTFSPTTGNNSYIVGIFGGTHSSTFTAVPGTNTRESNTTATALSCLVLADSTVVGTGLNVNVSSTSSAVQSMAYILVELLAPASATLWRRMMNGFGS